MNYFVKTVERGLGIRYGRSPRKGKPTLFACQAPNFAAR